MGLLSMPHDTNSSKLNIHLSSTSDISRTRRDDDTTTGNRAILGTVHPDALMGRPLLASARFSARVRVLRGTAEHAGANRSALQQLYYHAAQSHFKKVEETQKAKKAQRPELNWEF